MFWADSSKVFSIFVVPVERRWWLEYPSKDPAAVGMDTACVQIIEDMRSMADLKTNIPERKLDASPCGADCRKCKAREEYECHGSPATNLPESFA